MDMRYWKRILSCLLAGSMAFALAACSRQGAAPTQGAEETPAVSQAPAAGAESPALEDIDDYTARSNLMWTSAMAENGILKVGRLTDFECHQIEHQLGAYTDCNHGQGLAVIHPAYYRRVWSSAVPKFARFARNVWGISAEGKSEEELAQAGIQALEAFIRACGLPTRLTELRSRVEITPELLRQAADSTNLLPNGPRQLTRDEVYEILMERL